MSKKTSYAMMRVPTHSVFLGGFVISAISILLIADQFGVPLIAPLVITKHIPKSFNYMFIHQETMSKNSATASVVFTPPFQIRRTSENISGGNQNTQFLDEKEHEGNADVIVREMPQNEWPEEKVKEKGKDVKDNNTDGIEKIQSNKDNPHHGENILGVGNRSSEPLNGVTNNTADAGAISINDDSSYDDKSKYLKQMAQARQLHGVNCKALFDEDEKEMERAKQLRENDSNYTGALRNRYYLNAVENCSRYLEKRGYIRSSLTQEEKEFSIAYSVMVYTDTEMFERLLLATYRPQNIYCLHVDAKADDEYFRTVSGIADCLPNVFMASKRIEVQWGQFSVLEQELVCMADLWKYPHWKYLINLTGQEFALRTNLELVQTFKALKGANCIKATIKYANKDRWKGKPPLEVQPVKGSVHIAVTRAYVDFVLHDNKSKTVLEWVKGTAIPDETFFQTLNYNSHLNVPGSYNGSDLENIELVSRYKYWPVGRHHTCKGPIRRGICILRLEALPILGQSYYLFANKFYLEQDRIVIGCLEEKIFNDTRDGFLGIRHFNTTPYSKLDYVQNHIPS